jgi:threonine/homoserine/homoserine lactone efflux protein
MIPLDFLSVFFTASLLLALTPGPDNMFVLTQAAIRGWRAGLAITVGLCTGLLVHTAGVAFGVAAIFQASTIAFTGLKLFGAAYLLYLAWQAFHAPAESLELTTGPAMPLFPLYRRGIVMNITNPKVSIFFLAFLPQFADPSRGLLAFQMIVLGIVFIIAAVLVFTFISVMAGAIGSRLRSRPAVQIYMNKIAGVIFAALAVKLALATR